MNVDDVAELKDELDDLMADNAERQDFFANVAKEGEDELLGELDELEAMVLEKEMSGMDLERNNAPIKKPVGKVQEEAKMEEEDEDEIELKKLMMA